jgi:hypothetical protein
LEQVRQVRQAAASPAGEPDIPESGEKPMSPRERKTGKIVFWFVSPILFAGLVRLFFLLFYFVLGMLLLWLFGKEHTPLVFWAALGVSCGCTLLAVGTLYRFFKIYILEEA